MPYPCAPEAPEYRLAEDIGMPGISRGIVDNKRATPPREDHHFKARRNRYDHPHQNDHLNHNGRRRLTIIGMQCRTSCQRFPSRL